MGIHQRKDNGKFEAYFMLTVDNKKRKKHIGTFMTICEARKAREKFIRDIIVE